MKRLISLCLILAMCFSLCACGEAQATTSTENKDKFSFRNGINFGDSKKQVKQKENELTFDTENTGSTRDFLRFEGDIAGYDGTAYFYFSKDNELTDMKYHFIGGPTEMLDIYTTILESCLDKYGEPTNDTSTGKISAFYGEAYKEAIGDSDTKLLYYTEWNLMGKYDENVVIDLVFSEFHRYSPFESWHFTCDISYHTFSDLEWAQVALENLEKQADAKSSF